MQCIHTELYDAEPAAVQMMHEFAEQNGCKVDIASHRFHHEIDLSDPKMCVLRKMQDGSSSPCYQIILAICTVFPLFSPYEPS